MKRLFFIVILISGCILLGEKRAYTLTPLFNRDYEQKVLELINFAQYSIHIAMFVMKRYDKGVNELIDALCEKALSGVDVKVILEFDYDSSVVRTNTPAYEYLKLNNVQVRKDPIGICTHTKLIIIDGEKVIIGSTNWTYSALYENNETSVLIEDKDFARECENYFNDLWNISRD